jgi:hypothetical protein
MAVWCEVERIDKKIFLMFCKILVLYIQSQGRQ